VFSAAYIGVIVQCRIFLSDAQWMCRLVRLVVVLDLYVLLLDELLHVSAHIRDERVLEGGPHRIS
jgi:hypothetical protein